MTRPIGYYVHHQGAGHWHRACALAKALDRPCTLIGTLAEIDTSDAPGPVIDLPDDRLDGFDGRDGEAERPLGLHYAPLSHSGIRTRMARIARWVDEADPALLVVDVSVEVALFARLLSVPTLVVRLAGTRTDPPHLEAFRSANGLIAPFPQELESQATPDWVRAKTTYAGFLASPPSDRIASGEAIVVVFGRGGSGGSLPELAAAARAVPDRIWHVLGPVSGDGDRPGNLHLHGWVGDVDAHLAKAALVVGGAGDGLVAAVAAHRKPFLCLPEPRAYGEQSDKAHALSQLGAALVHDGWPAESAWPELVARGLALDPRMIGALSDDGALARCAAMIETTARIIEGRGP